MLTSFIFYSQCLFTVCFSDQEEPSCGMSTAKSNYFYINPHYLVSITPAVTYYWFLSCIIKKKGKGWNLFQIKTGISQFCLIKEAAHSVTSSNSACGPQELLGWVVQAGLR